MKSILFRLAISSVFVLSLAGCASETTPTTQAKKPLTSSQQRQIQSINAMQARWRNDDMLMYSRVPGGMQAWQAMQSENRRNFD